MSDGVGVVMCLWTLRGDGVKISHREALDLDVCLLLRSPVAVTWWGRVTVEWWGWVTVKWWGWVTVEWWGWVTVVATNCCLLGTHFVLWTMHFPKSIVTILFSFWYFIPLIIGHLLYEDSFFYAVFLIRGFTVILCPVFHHSDVPELWLNCDNTN